MVTSVISFLLLTEDTGEHAFATQKALTEKMLHLVAEGCAVRRIDFQPGDEPTRAGMGFNAYISTESRDYRKKIDLAGAIATHLLRDDITAFVLVHIDGDRNWTDRGEHPLARCSNQEIFVRTIVRPVEAILEQEGRPELIERLRYMLPFWSVEAWLYQNSVELAAICAEHAPRHERDANILRDWRSDPACLDSVVRPKATATTLQDRYNARLARSLPARKIYDLGLSFAATVDGLKACSVLTTALETLRYPIT